VSRRRPAWVDRLFRALLRLYPFDFRGDYGDEMADLFRHQRRDAERAAGRRGGLGITLRSAADVLRTAPRQHWDLLRQDLRLAFRSLRRSPGFTAVALLTAALGIGANTALFSVVDAVLLRPLPYPQPQRLVRLWSVDESGSRGGVSLHDLEDWRHGVPGLAHLAAWNVGNATLSGEDGAERVRQALVGRDFFAVLGRRPVLGRTFTAAEEAPGGGGAAVISHRLWMRRLDGDPGALGRVLRLDGRPVTVVGVLAADFAFPDDGVDLWTPIALSPEQSGDRGGRWLSAVARLAPGVELDAARRQLAAVAARLAADYPASNRGWGIEAEPLHASRVGDARRALLLLWAMVGLVLLLACVNLASLLLARGAARRREMAVRTALGAQPWRLLRLLLTESLLLAALGGALGLALALGLVELAPHLAPSLPQIATLSLDGRALLVTGLLAMTAGVLFGLAPARSARRPDPVRELRGAGDGGAARAARRWLGGWNALLAAEVALAVVVLVAAGLLLGSFARLTGVDPGFAAGGVLTFRVEPPSRVDFDGEMDDVLRAFATDRRRATDFYQQLVRRLEALPGVASAAAVNQRPLGPPGAWTTTLWLPGDAADRRRPPVRWRAVTPGYLASLGTPVVAGRDLRWSDRAAAPPVVVVSRSLARVYWPGEDRAGEDWPGEDPVGRRLTHDDPASPHALWYTVAGVVADAHYDSLADGPTPVAFVAMDQARFGFFTDWGMDVLLRSAAGTDPLALTAAVRREVAALDPELPVFAVTTLERSLLDQAADRRRAATLSAFFALLALVLAAAGIFGVVSYRVERGRHEIGVRMALGAGRRRVLASVVTAALAPVVLGAALGLVLAYAAAGLLTHLLYDTPPGDPWTYAAAVALLLAAALTAATVPARRAARTDPLRVLRGA